MDKKKKPKTNPFELHSILFNAVGLAVEVLNKTKQKTLSVNTRKLHNF